MLAGKSCTPITASMTSRRGRRLNQTQPGMSTPTRFRSSDEHGRGVDPDRRYHDRCIGDRVFRGVLCLSDHEAAMSTLEIPPVHSDVTTLADWFAEHEKDVKEMRSALFMMAKRLTEYYEDNGDIQTPHGTLSRAVKGYDWDDAAIGMVKPD